MTHSGELIKVACLPLRVVRGEKEGEAIQGAIYRSTQLEKYPEIQKYKSLKLQFPVSVFLNNFRKCTCSVLFILLESCVPVEKGDEGKGVFQFLVTFSPCDMFCVVIKPFYMVLNFACELHITRGPLPPISV